MTEPTIQDGDPDEAETGAPEPEPDGPKNDPVPEDDDGES